MKLINDLESLRIVNVSLSIDDRQVVANAAKSLANHGSLVASNRDQIEAGMLRNNKLIKKMDSLAYNNLDLSISERLLITKAISELKSNQSFCQELIALMPVIVPASQYTNVSSLQSCQFP